MTTIQEELNRVIAALPDDRAQIVLDFAKKLATPASEVKHEDWTEEDRREARLNSLRRFESEHGEENWGVDYAAPTEGK